MKTAIKVIAVVALLLPAFAHGQAKPPSSGGGSVTIGAFGAVPNAKGMTVTGGTTINLQPSSGTHPGAMSAADKAKLDAISGTNTGDQSVTIGTFGSSPDAKGASATGTAVTIQPADATHPGAVTTGTQSFGGVKTFPDGMATTYLDLTSAVDGQNALKLESSSRIAFGSDARYMTDDGSNIRMAGTFIPTATITYDFGDTGHIWGTAYIYAATLASGQIRDSSSTQRIVVNDSTLNIYNSEAATGYSHEFKIGGVSAAAIGLEGGIRPNSGAVAKPTCNSAHRGQIWYSAGGAGVADAWERCTKDAGDSYAWEAL